MPDKRTPFEFGYQFAHEYRINNPEDRDYARTMLTPEAQAGWDAYFAKREKGGRHA